MKAFHQTREDRVRVVRQSSTTGLPSLSQADKVKVPQDPRIVEVIEHCLCRVRLGEDCYVVTGATGREVVIPYGAPISRWDDVCEGLLEEALRE